MNTNDDRARKGAAARNLSLVRSLSDGDSSSMGANHYGNGSESTLRSPHLGCRAARRRAWQAHIRASCSAALHGGAATAVPGAHEGTCRLDDDGRTHPCIL